MNERKNRGPLVAAFLAGVIITAIAAFFLLGQMGGSAKEDTQVEADASGKAQAESDASGAAQAEADASEASQVKADASEEAKPESDTSEASQPQADSSETAVAADKDIDYASVFPSWNPDSESLSELVDFVADVTDESSPGYLDPADRIAVFDMDGTILCEKAPVYVDYCLTMYRVLDDPSYEATEEERDAMQQVRDHAYSEGKTFHPEGITKDDLVASAFAGMTPEEFRAYVVDFADHEEVVGFEGMTYGQSFYKPMIEVIEYLKANNFDVWMVSACEREVVRALVERYDIPYDHVIATDVPYVASAKGEEAADDYNMGKDEQILLGAPLDEVECGKSGKPAAITREITARAITPCSIMPRAILTTGAWASSWCATTPNGNMAAMKRLPSTMTRWKKKAGRPSRWQMTGRRSMATACRRRSCRGQRNRTLRKKKHCRVQHKTYTVKTDDCRIPFFMTRPVLCFPPYGGRGPVGGRGRQDSLYPVFRSLFMSIYRHVKKRYLILMFIHFAIFLLKMVRSGYGRY